LPLLVLVQCFHDAVGSREIPAAAVAGPRECRLSKG
jgi:hypothetical protein